MCALIHDFDFADTFPIILKVNCTRFHHSGQSVANLRYIHCRDTKHVFVSQDKKKWGHEITILFIHFDV
jgi:hypothetical protein